MTDITIPPEALEAAARAACEDRGYDWDKYINFRPAFRRIAHAALRAGIAAWPGMQHCRWNELNAAFTSHLILPLPKENAND